VRYYYCLYFLLLISQCGFGQSESKICGVVVELNSKFNTGETKYISNAQIISKGANPQLSDTKGQFIMIFPDKQVGSLVEIEVFKDEYLVVNEQVIKYSAIVGNKKPIKIVMSKYDDLLESQITYYEIAYKSFLNSYKNKIAILQGSKRKSDSLISKLKIDFEQDIKTINQAKELLQNELGKSKDYARSLADRFSTINLDDETEIYQEVFKELLKGNIENVLKKINEFDPIHRIKINSAEKFKEEKLITELNDNIRRRESQIREDIKLAVLLAKTHQLNYNYSDAQHVYESAREYDSLSFNLNLEYAYFLTNTHKNKEALKIYETILSQLNDTLNNKNESYKNQLPVLLSNYGKLLYEEEFTVKGKNILMEALNKQRNLFNQNSSYIYKYNLFGILNRFGIALSNDREYNEADRMYSEALEIIKNLKDFKGELHIDDYAYTLNNHATNQWALGKLLKVENSLIKSINLLEELSIKDSLSINIRYYLSTSYHNYGAYLISNNKNKLGNQYIEKALKMKKELYKLNPDLYSSYLASTLAVIAILSDPQKGLNYSEKYFKEAIRQFEISTKFREQEYSDELAKLYIKYGSSLENVGRFEDAIYYYNRCYVIAKGLKERNPKKFMKVYEGIINSKIRVYFKMNNFRKAEKSVNEWISVSEKINNKNSLYTAIAYNNIGMIYNEIDFNLSEKYLKISIDIKEVLIKKDKKISYSYLANSYQSLGNLYKDYKIYNKAIEQYNKTLIIRKNLAKKEPNNYNILVNESSINLCIVYKSLFLETGNYEYLKKGKSILKELDDYEINSNNQVEEKRLNLIKQHKNELLSFFTNVKTFKE
tara:strand:+ start:776 stop:3262 length:2487 start_codon:yes stop_codon:yes gene_type:complete